MNGTVCNSLKCLALNLIKEPNQYERKIVPIKRCFSSSGYKISGNSTADYGFNHYFEIWKCISLHPDCPEHLI